MELIQFSTLRCPPCKDARDYITRNYDIELINYTYVPFEYINDFDPRYEKLATELQIRGVPHFVVVDEGNVIHTFSGFGGKAKAKIDQYASYVTDTVNNKIKNCLPEDVEKRLEEAYNKSLELIEPDFEGLDINTPPSLNGHKQDLDNFDDFDNLDDEDDDDYEGQDLEDLLK